MLACRQGSLGSLEEHSLAILAVRDDWSLRTPVRDSFRAVVTVLASSDSSSLEDDGIKMFKGMFEALVS